MQAQTVQFHNPEINNAPEKTKVAVTDIEMPFGSMVIFMIKWALASIPAAIILMMIGGMAAGLLLLMFGGIFSAFTHPGF